MSDLRPVGLPAALWRLVMPDSLPAVTRSADPASSGPDWQVGQELWGELLSAGEGEALLLIDGHELTAYWPRAEVEPGSKLLVRVLAKTGGQWFLEPVTDEGGHAPRALPTATILTLLEQFGWDFNFSNVERLGQLLRGEKPGQRTVGEVVEEEFCPPNLDTWQEIFGFDPGPLAVAFFAWDPLPAGLFVSEEGARGARETGDEAPLSFVFALDLPALGQIEVVARGHGLKQSLLFVARQETVAVLEKRREEIKTLVEACGVEVTGLRMVAGAKPLLQLVNRDLVPYRRLDRRL